MALINNLYVFVESESVNHNVESTSHPVENGIALTDHVRRQPLTISISGKIVKHGNMEASAILSELLKLQKEGSLITYVGRNTDSNLQIQSFSTSHPNTTWGGCEFSMELKEIRVAKSAYVEVKEEVKDGGTQKVDEGDNEAVYHTVKKGDCCWNLVTYNYKDLDRGGGSTMQQCNWIMEKNPSAFSKKGDFRTLQIGKKLLVGYRKVVKVAIAATMAKGASVGNSLLANVKK